jgi:hypothetical protein
MGETGFAHEAKGNDASGDANFAAVGLKVRSG